MDVEQTHEQKETLSEDVFEPGHDPRTVTATFRKTKKELEELGEDRCFICNATASEAGLPLEAHHVIIERCFTNGTDWRRVQAVLGGATPEELALLASSKQPILRWLHRIMSFDWASFNPDSEEAAYAFVDNMLANGLMLCKKHHTGKDEGIHDLSFPIFLFQKFAKPGYKFSPDEVIHYFS